MRVRCSYCRAEYAQKEPLDDDKVTHGICPDCTSYYRPQWDGETLDRFLDRYDFPVFAVNQDRRVVAVNRAMEEMLGRNAGELRGLRGGEATECAYARLPEGCGHAVHCQRCTIRKTVVDTHASGLAHQRVPAVLDLDDERVRYLISTELHGDLVYLLIEEVVSRAPRDPNGPAFGEEQSAGGGPSSSTAAARTALATGTVPRPAAAGSCV